MRKPKKPKPGKKPKCPQVVLTEGQDPNPAEAHVRRSTKGQICFCNRTNRGRTVHFDLWPFVEPPQDIPIDVGKCSKCFTVPETQALGTYTYSVVPALNPGGPPDEPGIVVDG